MYPWESALSGEEETPVWALSGPFEHHISGCIAWAFWKYYQLTGDKAWLKAKGYPVLQNIAQFWVSRAETDETGKYHIINVVGADEFAENVDDIAFANGVTKEYRGYDGREIKQADVNLLAYPLNIVIDAKQIQRDLHYYEKRMSPTGPAMGLSVLSVLYNRLGNTNKSYELFKRSYQPLKLPPFGVLAEYAGGTNPYFATGAGGLLQAVIAGFGGLEVTEQGIVQGKSILPPNWTSLTIKGLGVNRKTFSVSH